MIKLHFNIVSFFGRGGEGVEGEVFVTACQCFKQLYLKTRFSLFTDPLFSLQRRWSRCTYEHKKLWGIYWPLAQGGGGRESHARSPSVLSLTSMHVCQICGTKERKRENICGQAKQDMAMPILNFFVQDRSKRIDHSHISMNEGTNSRLGLGVKK